MRKLISGLTAGLAAVCLYGCANTNILPVKEGYDNLPVEHYKTDTLRLPKDTLIAVPLAEGKTPVIGGKAINPEVTINRVFVPASDFSGEIQTRFLRGRYLKVDPTKPGYDQPAYVLVAVDSNGKSFSIPEYAKTDATDVLFLDKKRTADETINGGLEIIANTAQAVETRTIDGKEFAVYALSNAPQLKDEEVIPIAFMYNADTGNSSLRVQKGRGEISDRVTGKEYILVKVKEWVPTEEVLKAERVKLAAQQEAEENERNKRRVADEQIYQAGLEHGISLQKADEKARNEKLFMQAEQAIKEQRANPILPTATNQ